MFDCARAFLYLNYICIKTYLFTCLLLSKSICTTITASLSHIQMAQFKCSIIITFCMSCRRCKMYVGHARLCEYLCVCLSLAVCRQYCMDPDVTLWNGRGCPLVVNYQADLQSVHGFHCYDNTAPNAKCQRVLVFTLCLVIIVISPCRPSWSNHHSLVEKNARSELHF